MSVVSIFFSLFFMNFIPRINKVFVNRNIITPSYLSLLFLPSLQVNSKGKNQIYDFPCNIPNTSADPMVPLYLVLYVWNLLIYIMTYMKAVQVRTHLCWSQKFHLVFASPCCFLDSAIVGCFRKERKNTGFWQKIGSLSQLFCDNFCSCFPYSCYLFSSCSQ